MTISERINAERIVLFGWSRGILLQLAHPLVAAGVADHSTFRGGRFGAVVRLHHTIRAMTSLTFGTEEARTGALAKIVGIHRRVNGRLGEAVGPFAAGTPYSAEDPALVAWVHATLLESMPLVYELLVGPLSDDERDRYCREAAPLARALGARAADVPQSWRALREYLERMHTSGVIVVGDTARDLARGVLAPNFSAVVAPVARANRIITTALLPDTLRQQYGLPWTRAEQASFPRWVRLLHLARCATPRPFRIWPEARRAAAGSPSASESTPHRPVS